MSIRPAANYHGPDAVSSYRGTSPSFGAGNVRHAGAGMPFQGDVRCAANNGTCSAPRAKGTELCIGHLRSLNKAYGVSSEQS